MGQQIETNMKGLSENFQMNKLTSNICIGTIGGLYVGLIFMSFFIFFFAQTNYQALEIFVFYGYAMAIGAFFGGLYGWLFLKK